MRSVFIALTGLLLIGACASQKNKLDEEVWNPKLSDPATFHRTMGRAYLARRDFPRALSHLQAAKKHDPDNAHTHLLLGIVYRERGLSQDAEQALLRAIDLDDELADAYAALGVLYDRTNRSKKADAMHRRALEIDGERAEFHNNLGFSLYLRGQYLQAVPSFRAAIRLGGGDRIHNNLGFAYGRLGEYARAYREFRRAGSEAEALNNVGYVYELRGELGRAQQAYSDALKADPNLAQAKKNLDNVAKRMGKPQVGPEPVAPPITGQGG